LEAGACGSAHCMLSASLIGSLVEFKLMLTQGNTRNVWGVPELLPRELSQRLLAIGHFMDWHNPRIPPLLLGRVQRSTVRQRAHAVTRHCRYDFHHRRLDDSKCSEAFLLDIPLPWGVCRCGYGNAIRSKHLGCWHIFHDKKADCRRYYSQRRRCW
jgi:hypothetical protein